MKKSLIYLFCFPFFIFAQIPTAGLIGSWPFTGNANDESPNNNNGVVSGATLTTDRFGTPDRAYNFDGVNDQILIPASPELYRYNTSFTISAWVRRTDLPQGFTQPIFTNRNPTSGSEFYIDGALNGYEGNVGYASYNGSVYGLGHSTGPIAINNGYQNISIAYVHNGSNNNIVKFYVNGSLNNVVSGLVNITLSTEDTYIGWSPHFTQANRHFKGDIDDIFLYDRELSASEIQVLYNSSTTETKEEKITKLHVYPNPASNLLYIDGVTEEIMYYSIIKVDGSIIKEDQLMESIDVSEIVPGMYTLLFLDKNRKVISMNKFVK
jgi:hypothetical protein